MPDALGYASIISFLHVLDLRRFENLNFTAVKEFKYRTLIRLRAQRTVAG
jgi:hypothetical protein